MVESVVSPPDGAFVSLAREWVRPTLRRLDWPLPLSAIQALNDGQRNGSNLHRLHPQALSRRATELGMERGLAKLAKLFSKDREIREGIIILDSPLLILSEAFRENIIQRLRFCGIL